MDLKMILEICAMLLTAGAIYGAIRSDIKHIHEKMHDMKDDMKAVEENANEAHKRIDYLLVKGIHHGS